MLHKLMFLLLENELGKWGESKVGEVTLKGCFSVHDSTIKVNQRHDNKERNIKDRQKTSVFPPTRLIADGPAACAPNVWGCCKKKPKRGLKHTGSSLNADKWKPLQTKKKIITNKGIKEERENEIYIYTKKSQLHENSTT